MSSSSSSFILTIHLHSLWTLFLLSLALALNSRTLLTTAGQSPTANLTPSLSQKVDVLNASSSTTNGNSADKRSGDLWYLEQSVPWPPMPYTFGYEVRDPYGNEQYRRETADSSGQVNGAYGYWGPDGIYRHVDYVADHLGYRAKIRTSEPGTSSEDPADVEISSKPVATIPLPYVPPPTVPVTSAPPPSSISSGRSNNNPLPYSRPSQASFGDSGSPRTDIGGWPRSPSYEPSRSGQGILYEQPPGLSYGGFGVRTSLPPTTTQVPPSKVSINPDGPRRTTRVFGKTNRDRYNHPMNTGSLDAGNNLVPPPPVKSKTRPSSPRFAPEDVQVTDGPTAPPTTQVRIRTTRQMSHESLLAPTTPVPPAPRAIHRDVSSGHVGAGPSAIITLPNTSRMARKPSDSFFMKQNEDHGDTRGHSEERILTHSIYVNSHSAIEPANAKVTRTEDPISGVMYEESYSDHRSVGNFAHPPPPPPPPGPLPYSNSWASERLHPTPAVVTSTVTTSTSSSSSHSSPSSFNFNSISNSNPSAKLLSPILQSLPESTSTVKPYNKLHPPPPPLPPLPKFYRTGLLEVPAPPSDLPSKELLNLKLRLPPGTGDPATIATSTSTTSTTELPPTTISPSNGGRLAFDENRPAYYSSYKETHHPLPPAPSDSDDDSANNFSSSRYVSVTENGYTVLYPARPISYQYHRQVVSLRPRKMVSGLFTTQNPRKYSSLFKPNSLTPNDLDHHRIGGPLPSSQDEVTSKLPLVSGRKDEGSVEAVSRESATLDLVISQSNSQKSTKNANVTSESYVNETTTASDLPGTWRDESTGDVTSHGDTESGDKINGHRATDNISSGIIVTSNDPSTVATGASTSQDPNSDIGYASNEDVDLEGEIGSSSFEESDEATSTEDSIVNVNEPDLISTNTTSTAEDVTSTTPGPLEENAKLTRETSDAGGPSRVDSGELQQAALEDEDTSFSSEDLWQ